MCRRSALGILVVSLLVGLLGPVSASRAAPLVEKYLAEVPAGDLVPGADSYGPVRDDVAVVPALRGDETIGYVFLNADFVTTTGYSGKPIHVLIGLDPDAHITGARLVKHSEPIVLIGIPEAKIKAVIDKYAGLDLIAQAEGGDHTLDIVSGATVTVMVIDDSILRSGLKVARLLGLGGLEPEAAAAGPAVVLRDDPDPRPRDWQTLTGDGSVRTLDLDVGEVNAAFEATGDKRAIDRPEKGDPADTFIDLEAALVSVPAIGRSLLGPAEYANLKTWLGEGEQAILLMGRGKYSFKGSGYVRGGIFDRIHLIQGENTVRFHDKQHRRLGALGADGAPDFTELDLFKIPADSGFDPAEPFRIQLLVQRSVGAIDKVFATFDLGYQAPAAYFEPVAAPVVAQTAEVDAEIASSEPDELSHLWKQIWERKSFEVAALLAALGVLTGAFFFQMQLTRNETVVYWFRIGFLTFTLVFLGWYANAQLSVVNILAFFSAVTTDFSWSAFLMDPLIFILWFSAAAASCSGGAGRSAAGSAPSGRCRSS